MSSSPRRTRRCSKRAISDGPDGERNLTPEYIAGLRASSSTLFAFLARWNGDNGERASLPGPRFNPNVPDPSSNQVTRDASKESSLGDGITELLISDMAFQFLDVGVYMLIAQAARFTPRSCLSRTISAVRDAMRFHLGTFDNVSQDESIFESMSDIVSHVLDGRSSLMSLTSGLPVIPISSRTQATLDRVLSGLEDNPNVYGSALIIGKSVLHRRLPAWTGRMMLLSVSARPMKACAIRSMPVFVDNKAQNMFMVRLTSSLIMGVFVHITASFNEVLPYLEHLEASLDDYMFQLPREEPPIQLRTYTGLDTLAFVYCDDKAGKAIVPALRFDEGQQAMNSKVTESFHWFYESIMSMEGGRAVTQATLSNANYIFHFVQKNEHARLSVLYSALIEGNVRTLTDEIFDNVRRSSA